MNRKTLSEILRESTVVYGSPKRKKSIISELVTPKRRGSMVCEMPLNTPLCKGLKKHQPHHKKSNNSAAVCHTFVSDKLKKDTLLGQVLEERYLVLEKIAEGGYCTVFKVIDLKSKKYFALKFMKGTKLASKAGENEVGFLRKLSESDYFPDVLCSFFYEKHKCIIIELLGMSLFQLLESTDFNGFSLQNIWTITKQLLQALYVLSSANIVHSDIKPENIFLIDLKNYLIKLGDFGCSFEDEGYVKGYMQSRYYRAPEVLFELICDKNIDMWSLGCLCAELFLGYPLLQGKDYKNQIIKIVELIGPPDERYLANVKDDLSELARRTKRVKSLENVLQGSSGLFVDFVSSCLRYRNRLTPETALMHPWIASCGD
ncbi:hypothetical protein SteCoe_29545 [Stentor coeruleus]|uniref:Protein kinase domain-containing protein n=1 Tax=Stentor coeruleus TaxID=5963 RepID=A0A1R2B5M5_9CILI|nr:hypothetical protein SteCoe_29545 [Stentor coeruleus]